MSSDKSRIAEKASAKTANQNSPPIRYLSKSPSSSNGYLTMHSPLQFHNTAIKETLSYELTSNTIRLSKFGSMASSPFWSSPPTHQSPRSPPSQQIARWDSIFSLKSAPFRSRIKDHPTEETVQNFETNNSEESNINEDEFDIARNSLSSGSSNASVDSSTSSNSRTGSIFEFSFPLDIDWTNPPVLYDSPPYAADVQCFLASFYTHLKSSKVTWEPQQTPTSIFEHVLSVFKRFSAARPRTLKSLSEAMYTSKLMIPYGSFDLPSEAILLANEPTQQESGNNSPTFGLYQQHPLYRSELRKLELMFQKYDTSKEVIAYMIWSVPDKQLIVLPKTILSPYPHCWNCLNNFGVKGCGQCKVARYCSRDCQVAHWPDHQEGCESNKEILEVLPNPFVLNDTEATALP